jgi:hypothetical protein
MKTIKRNYKLAAAICLACGVSSAQAAISTGGWSGDGNLGNDQSGELFLNIWDQTASSSYAIDLGISVDTFVAGSASSHVWNLDQRFINWAATGNPLIFNVAGNNSYTNDWAASNFGVLATIRTGQSVGNGTITLTDVDTWISKFESKTNALNTVMNAQNGNLDPDRTDFAANLSEVTINTASSAYFTKEWGTTQGIANWVGSATVRGSSPDQTLDFLFIHSPGGPTATDTTAAIRDRLNGYITLDASAATLTWHSNVAAVPLPASVWMFLSGLLATLRFHKRKIFSLTA